MFKLFKNLIILEMFHRFDEDFHQSSSLLRFLCINFFRNLLKINNSFDSIKKFFERDFE